VHCNIVDMGIIRITTQHDMIEERFGKVDLVRYFQTATLAICPMIRFREELERNHPAKQPT